MAFSAEIDLHSFTWQAVKHMADSAIEEAQALLEQRIEERDADICRGKIIAMREILDLANRNSEHVSEQG